MEVWNWILNHYGFILAVLGVFGISLEVGSKKHKPISWVLNMIGRACNTELQAKMQEIAAQVALIDESVSSLKNDFMENKREMDLREIYKIRKEISEFVLSLQRNEKHTRDDFDRIFERLTAYHKLLDMYGLENGKIETEAAYIEDTYNQCLVEQCFFEG